MNSEADPPDPPAGDDMSAEDAAAGALLPRDADERFHELFAREHKPLVSFIVGLNVTRVEAQDIAAEAFAQLLKSKDLSSISKLHAYLYKSARNITFNRHKHLAMQRRNAPLLEAEHSETSPSPEPALMGQQRRELLLRILAQLPPRWQTSMKLSLVEDLSYQEIVERFHSRGIEINERTVRRDVKRGMAECRKAIRAAEDPSEEPRK